VTGSGKKQTTTTVVDAIARNNVGPGGSWQVVNDFEGPSTGTGSGGSYYDTFITDNAGASYAGGAEGS
jgi:hypothetical protein